MLVSKTLDIPISMDMPNPSLKGWILKWIKTVDFQLLTQWPALHLLYFMCTKHKTVLKIKISMYMYCIHIKEFPF